jgi:hypothetical protein
LVRVCRGPLWVAALFGERGAFGGQLGAFGAQLGERLAK